MKQVAHNMKLMTEIFSLSSADKNSGQFVSDVLCGKDVIDCPVCGENSLHLSINDSRRSQAFFCCLNDECCSKFRVDVKGNCVDKL